MATEHIIFLPGLLCDDAVWVSQREALKSRAQTFVANYESLDSIEAMAEKVLQTAPYDVFSLAGHSMGGRVAMEVVHQAPERVRRLALLDTAYEPKAQGEAGQQEQSKRMALLAHAKEHGMRSMGRLWAAGMVHIDRLETPLFESILDMVERRTPEQFQAQITALLNRPDATPVLKTLACPTLLLCGRQDAWSPFKLHEAMSRLVSPSYMTLRAIENCGHMSTMERPEEVSRLLNAWLDSVS